MDLQFCRFRRDVFCFLDAFLYFCSRFVSYVNYLIMKKVTLFIMLMCALLAHGQSSNETKTITAFAELLGWNTNILGLKGKVNVEVDFGDESWGWQGNDGRNLLVDEDGKQIKFNSMVDAMNFMGERGWVFEAAYVVTVNNQNVIHWLMSKEIPLDGNAKEGIIQLRDSKKKKNKSNRFDDSIYN